jgi:uncharacterized protein Veg
MQNISVGIPFSLTAAVLLQKQVLHTQQAVNETYAKLFVIQQQELQHEQNSQNGQCSITEIQVRRIGLDYLFSGHSI